MDNQQKIKERTYRQVRNRYNKNDRAEDTDTSRPVPKREVHNQHQCRGIDEETDSYSKVVFFSTFDFIFYK